MKKPKFKYIKQLDTKGCVPASIAMILGKSYKEITDKFFMDFDKEGLTLDKTVDFLLNNNLTLVNVMFDRATIESKNLYCRHMLKPFADIHLTRSQPWADDEVMHCSIMDSNGKIHDPGNKKIKSLDDYYEVLQIIGIWYER